ERASLRAVEQSLLRHERVRAPLLRGRALQVLSGGPRRCGAPTSRGRPVVFPLPCRTGGRALFWVRLHVRDAGLGAVAVSFPVAASAANASYGFASRRIEQLSSRPQGEICSSADPSPTARDDNLEH